MARTVENAPGPNEEILYHSNENQAEFRPQERRNEDEREARVTTSRSSSLELLAAGAAIVLAIFGLTCTLTLLMSAIATIAIGAALFAHGAAVAACWHETVRRAGRGHRLELATGVGSEMLGGAAGILLGLLALANCQSLVLIPVASIVFGGAILLGAHAQTNIAAVEIQLGRLTVQAVEVTSSAIVLAGVGAVVLGVLGLINVAPPLTLALVAMLTVGGALLLVGGTLSARFARIQRQEA